MINECNEVNELERKLHVYQNIKEKNDTVKEF